MSFKNKADANRWHKEYYAQKKLDPEWLEKQRTYKREWKRKKMLDPEYRKKSNEYAVRFDKLRPKKEPSYYWAKALRSRCTKYGITVERYNEITREQNNLCAICNKPETRIRCGTLSLLSIDHNHETGEVRALLCANCNLGLACFKESVKVVEQVIQYIKKYNKGSSNGS